jgi:hypothetical protein
MRVASCASRSRPIRRAVPAPYTTIRVWEPGQLVQVGFNAVCRGEQASIIYARRQLRLALTANTSSSASTIARITEVDSFPWQATDAHPIVMRVSLRFDQATPPPNLTEVAFLWNAPFLTGRLASVVGVSRDHGAYWAIVAQDFDPTTGDGLLERAPIGIEATDWHTITIRVSTTQASVAITQRRRRVTVLTRALPHPMEPLAAEVSIDNDNVPEGRLPVVMPDALSVRSLGITQR